MLLANFDYEMTRRRRGTTCKLRRPYGRPSGILTHRGSMARSNVFACFMAHPAGRLLRIVAGVALFGGGWMMRGTITGVVLMIVGVVPILAGVLNVCLLAPILGAPFSGRVTLEDERAAEVSR